MTREDVITELHMMQLKYVNDDGSSKFDDAENEAIYTAIEALEQPEIVHCKDCKWFVAARYSKYPEDRYCSYDNSDFSTNPEGFCYRGDRRDDMTEMKDISLSDAPTQSII